MKTIKSNFSHKIPKILKTFKIFGVFPYDPNQLHQNLLTIYTIIQLIYIFTIQFLVFSEVKTFSTTIFSGLVTCIVFVLQTIAFIVTICESWLKRHQQLQILEMLTEIDNYFQMVLLIPINYDKIIKKLNTQFWSILLLILINTIFIIAEITWDIFYGRFWYTFLAIFVLMMRCIQCSIYVELLNHRIEFLNMQISLIIQTQTDDQSSVIICHILILKKIYFHISDTVNLFNDSFGWSILIIFTSFFINIAINIYWIFMVIQLQRPFIIVLYCLSLTYPLVSSLLILAWRCDKCAKNVCLLWCVVFWG